MKPLVAVIGSIECPSFPKLNTERVPPESGFFRSEGA